MDQLSTFWIFQLLLFIFFPQWHGSYTVSGILLCINLNATHETFFGKTQHFMGENKLLHNLMGWQRSWNPTRLFFGVVSRLFEFLLLNFIYQPENDWRYTWCTFKRAPVNRKEGMYVMVHLCIHLSTEDCFSLIGYFHFTFHVINTVIQLTALQ